MVLTKVPLKTKEWDGVLESYNLGLSMTFGQTFLVVVASEKSK